MGRSFRQIMRDFADLFTLRRSNTVRERSTRASVKKSKKKRKQQQEQQQEQQQQQQQEQQQQQQHEKQHEQQFKEQHHQEQQYEEQQLLQYKQQQEQEQDKKQQKKKVEVECEQDLSIETPDESSSSDTDSYDDVFVLDGTCSLPAGESHTASDDEGNDDHVGGLAGCFPVTRKHSKTLPSIVVQDEPYCHQRRGSIANRHRSESHILMSQNDPPISATPTCPERASEITFDESTKEANNGRRLGHFRRHKKTSFSVKYTKVYGEADGAYRNDSTPRGLVFVCNISKFKNEVYSERVGSNKDYDNMINLFQQLGYDPFHRRRRYCMTGYITKKNFMEKLGCFAKELKHKVLCSCVVILMSHGTGPKTFVTSDNHEVDLLEVYKIFDNINCTFLLGKPKIFILQFCRSQETTSCKEKTLCEQQQFQNELLKRMVKEQVGQFMRKYIRQLSFSTVVAEGINKNQLLVHIEEKSRQGSLASLSSGILDQEQQTEQGASGSSPFGEYQVDTNKIPPIPQVGFQRYSDMYSIFSTSPGELSHRHPEKGSLLIQAICHVFAEYAYQDEIDTLVRRVSTYMTKTLQKDDPITVPRQTCERTNNGLDKLFYFNPYEMVQDRQFTI